MTKQILIRDLTLRDGQQSQFATRMNQKQVEKVLPFFKEANFYAMEVWGGAVPDSIMRYLSENPWYRLESIKKEIKTSKLTALSRGRDLFGYNPYPEQVIEGFNKNAIKSGVDIMRIFDALNDINNMKSTIKYVKENGGQTDCAVCYTADPKFTFLDKVKAIFSGKKIPGPIFTIDYFVNKAKELEKQRREIILNNYNNAKNSTFKSVIGLLLEPEMPKFTVSENTTNKDSVLKIKEYYYYKNHYFDYVNFTDSVIIRTPFFLINLKNIFRK